MFHLFPSANRTFQCNWKDPCFVSICFVVFPTPSSLQGNEKCHKQHLKTHCCHVTWSKLIIPKPRLFVLLTNNFKNCNLKWAFFILYKSRRMKYNLPTSSLFLPFFQDDPIILNNELQSQLRTLVRLKKKCFS